MSEEPLPMRGSKAADLVAGLTKSRRFVERGDIWHRLDVKGRSISPIIEMQREMEPLCRCEINEEIQ